MPGTTPVSTPAAAVRAAGWWGRAIAVPGLAALNQGRNAGVSSVSCPSPGSCAAGGFFRDGGGHQQGFVAVEGNGRWGQAVEVPGLAALNQGRNGEVLSVSCASAGYCAAGGYYGNHGNNPYDVTSGRGFVAVERNGRWGRAVEVPGLAALSKGGNAQVSSVSCAPAGSCAAGGAYTGLSDFRCEGFSGFLSYPFLGEPAAHTTVWPVLSYLPFPPVALMHLPYHFPFSECWFSGACRGRFPARLPCFRQCAEM